VVVVVWGGVVGGDVEVVVGAGAGLGLVVRVVVGGGLDQLVVHVYVVTQSGAGTPAGAVAESGLAGGSANWCGAAAGVFRITSLDLIVVELIASSIPALAIGLPELGMGAASGTGVLGGGGVLRAGVPAFADGLGSLRARK
jgi:hypothetical protein